MIRNTIDIMLGGCDTGSTPSVQQYDAKSRVYVCRLWEAPGVRYCMGKTAKVGAVFRWRRSGGGHEYDTEIENENTVAVTVPGEAVKLDGLVEFQLKIYENGGVLHGPVISFAAMRSLQSSETEEGEQALLLVALVNQTQELIADIEEKLENGEFNGEPGEPGKTPVKGVDYFTHAEIKAIAKQAAGMVDVQEPVERHEMDPEAHEGVIRRVGALEEKIDNVEGMDPEYVLQVLNEHNEDSYAHDHIQSMINQLTQALAAYLPLAGGRLTGSLNLGHVQSRESVLLTQHRQGSDEASKLQFQLMIDDQDTANLVFYKDGVMQNRVRLFADKTQLGKPLGLESGGLGVTTAQEALNVLGALPTAGGTMTGNLNLGTVNEAVSVILQMARLMSDGATKAQLQMYLTGGGSLKFDLYHAGTPVCSWTVASTYVRFSQQVQVPGEGAIVLGAVGSSGVVNHTLYSDKNPPKVANVTGLDEYLQTYVNDTILNGSW